MKRIYEILLRTLTVMLLSIKIVLIVIVIFWLITTFIIWENPITLLSQGYIKILGPLLDGWTILKRLILLLWVTLSVIIASHFEDI